MTIPNFKAGFDCNNVRQQGSVWVVAYKEVLNELAEHTAFIAAHLASQKVKLISTSELPTGSKHAMSETIEELMDSMYSRVQWFS